MREDWDPRETLRNIFIDALKRKGVPADSITDAMIAAEEEDMMARMEFWIARHQRIADRLKDHKATPEYLKLQGPHVDYPYVAEKLFTALQCFDGKMLDYPEHAVGCNIDKLAPLFEMDIADCRRKLQKSGYSINSEGLIDNHPAYKPRGMVESVRRWLLGPN